MNSICSAPSHSCFLPVYSKHRSFLSLALPTLNSCHFAPTKPIPASHHLTSFGVHHFLPRSRLTSKLHKLSQITLFFPGLVPVHVLLSPSPFPLPSRIGGATTPLFYTSAKLQAAYQSQLHFWSSQSCSPLVHRYPLAASQVSFQGPEMAMSVFCLQTQLL